ncbi:MAG: patatin-like phospholipase family protein [Caldilineaceae bacterium]
MDRQWNNLLPRPIAFAFSGGASLGAVQVGMLRALRTAGIQPDLIVGTSVGALNGAVIADQGLDAGIEQLTDLWTHTRCTDLFPGGALAQLGCLLQTGRSLFRQDGLLRLMQATLGARTFAALKLPLGVVATELRNLRSALFTQGSLHAALLASSAIPGLLPSVTINHRAYVDGCFTANVPLAAACQMGAASIVVLDAGNRRRSEQAPCRLADKALAKVAARLRHQVLVETPRVAQQLPLVYLPAPTLPPHRLLDFDGGAALIERTTAYVARFLATATPPAPGAMCGALQFGEVEREDWTQASLSYPSVQLNSFYA